jgi:hypothetical protein
MKVSWNTGFGNVDIDPFFLKKSHEIQSRFSLFVCLLFEAESCFIAQAGLEFTILLLTLLPLLLEWWDYRCEPPCQA